MNFIFQVDHLAMDFNTAEAAIIVVEVKGYGSVTKFVQQPNFHGGTDDKCIGLWTYEDKKWTSRSIHSGVSEAMAEEKPS